MRPSDLTRRKPDVLAGALVFLISLTIYWFSPVHQVTDSNYSMLLTQGLIEHQSFALDRFNIPRLEPVYHDHTWKNGSIRQLELIGDHFYYYMPPGSSVLSVPYVALLNQFGVSAKNPDGSYNAQGELRIETSLAAILVALVALTFFLTARLLLPTGWSVVIALGAAVGTQLWSTSSRALWADTWGIFLLSIVVYLLLAAELGKRRLNPELLATMLSWMYFVRPTYAVMIVAISIYVFIAHRDLFLRYAITGGVWLLAFIGYSWFHYHALLPTYFRVNRRVGFAYFWAALAGNLVSPSRGLLIYVPIVLLVVYLAVRYRKTVESRRLLLLAGGVILTFLVVISGFDPWWAGASYGPRYTAPLIPWFVLLAVLAVSAMRAAMLSGFSKRLLAVTAGLLLVLSVSINAIGAISKDAWITWNAYGDIDHDPWKVWDVRYPQLLAPFIKAPLPKVFPLAPPRLDLTAVESGPFLPYGWSGPETSFRWTDSSEAAVIFSLNELGDGRIRIRLTPFLVKGRHDLQRVEIRLNDRMLQSLNLRNEAAAIYEFPIKRDGLSQKNVLVFRLPDAASPSDFKINSDERVLGIAVNWIEFSFGMGQQ
jgi:hypothetical protein